MTDQERDHSNALPGDHAPRPQVPDNVALTSQRSSERANSYQVRALSASPRDDQSLPFLE